MFILEGVWAKVKNGRETDIRRSYTIVKKPRYDDSRVPSIVSKKDPSTYSNLLSSFEAVPMPVEIHIAFTASHPAFTPDHI
jgi:hypothetical protein